MPNFTVARLQSIGCELFEALGCRPESARVVVEHLVESNAFGHDSHGAIRFWEYSRSIRAGLYRAEAAPSVVSDRACMAVVDGGGALGQIGATFATRLAIDKARKQGTGTVSLRNTGHIGRVGAYPLIAAREGLVAQMVVNGGHHGIWVAPYGGTDGRLSTNPIAFAAPRPGGDPIMLDMTTSVAAIGKVWVAANRGKPLPEGWVLDPAGRPSTDPQALLGEPHGAMLPLGGPMGYKGSGLCLMVEVLGGALSGQGCAAGEPDVTSNGVLLNVFDIDKFAGQSAYDAEMAALVEHVKSSRRAPGVDEILLPGEPEFAHARRVEREGIDIDATTWEHICEEARHAGLDPGRWA